jgi:hypothetical protein
VAQLDAAIGAWHGAGRCRCETEVRIRVEPSRQAGKHLNRQAGNLLRILGTRRLVDQGRERFRWSQGGAGAIRMPKNASTTPSTTGMNPAPFWQGCRPCSRCRSRRAHPEQKHQDAGIVIALQLKLSRNGASLQRPLARALPAGHRACRGCRNLEAAATALVRVTPSALAASDAESIRLRRSR